MDGSRIPDPTEHSRWRPLRLLQAAMDAEIARLYAEAQIRGLKPSFVRELLRLHARGPMTITELAGSVQVTHSAASQKVRPRCAAELRVRTTAGADARSKKVTLTAKARRLTWPHFGGRMARHRGRHSRAGSGDPYPLSRVVTDIEEALQRKSFHDRIAGKLAEDPAWD